MSSISLDNLFSNNFVHFGSDGFLLWTLSIICLSFLTIWFSSESNGKDSEYISISRFTIKDWFDECFSFFNKRAELISSHIDTIERCDGLPAFGLIYNKLDFPPQEQVLVGSKISLHLSDNSSLNTVFHLSWNYLINYLDLEFCSHMWNRKNQTGMELVLSIRTILFLKEGQRSSSSYPSYRNFSYSFLEPLFVIMKSLLIK